MMLNIENTSNKTSWIGSEDDNYDKININLIILIKLSYESNILARKEEYEPVGNVKKAQRTNLASEASASVELRPRLGSSYSKSKQKAANPIG